ncbi:MAG: SprB repeat-containing protein, partial [Bacteroidetes bacterium]|nr:SprB repeat-containing protein [Bacteroidota bacterium]
MFFIFLSFGYLPLFAQVNQRSGSTVKESPDRNARIGNTRTIITVTAISTPSTCGMNNGAVIAQASGGVPPYIYKIGPNSEQNTGNFQDYFPGNYTVTVSDANGDVGTANVTVSNNLSAPDVLIAGYTNVSSCGANDASVTLAPGPGGLPPYEYSLDLVNFQSSPVFSNLYTGSYYFFMRDANGCIVANSNASSIGYYGGQNCTMAGAGLLHVPNATCNNSASLTVTAPGHNGPYTYSLDGINYGPDTVFANLAPGVYNIHYKDADGAVYVFAINVFLSCGIEVTYVTMDAACGADDGVITVTAANGIAPYTFTIDGINYQSSGTFTGLAPGNYTATVKDASGKSSSRYVAVYDRCPQVTAVSTHATCPSDNNGTITATGTRGTPPYFFSLDGISYQPGNTFSGLTAG